jgi:hypothetical protein
MCLYVPVLGVNIRAVTFLQISQVFLVQARPLLYTESYVS